MNERSIVHERTVHGLLESQARRFGGREFLYFEDRTLSSAAPSADRESSRVGAPP